MRAMGPEEQAHASWTLSREGAASSEQRQRAASTQQVRTHPPAKGLPVAVAMKIFILLTLVAVAVARPEPPLASSYFPSESGSSGGGYPAAQYGAPQQQPVIHKHVYVHVPPPEQPEYKAPKYVAPPPPPQKHYKIVFIKAPTPPTPTAPALPPLPQPDEEKTLIYVLVKKPEEQPDIVIPTPAPTQPSKPEVYFIRYKTQKEQQGAYGPPNAQPGTPIDNYGPPSSNDGPY